MLRLSIVLLATLYSAYAAKILLVPGPATSHCLEMMSVGEELLKRGHHVTLYPLLFDSKHCISRVSADSFKTRFKNMIPTLDEFYQKKHDDLISISLDSIFQRQSLLPFLAKNAKYMMSNLCDAAFYDKNVLKELQKDNYDIAVVEAVPFTSCLFSVPIFLGIPSAALGSLIDPQDSRMPIQTNILPSIFTEHSNEMTFIQRVLNTVIFLMNPVVRYFILPSIDLSQYSPKLAGYDTRNLVKDAVLFLENSDHVVDYPKAVFPNFVQVGALTAGPSRPLSVDLKKFMDDSKDGVVLVTFGSTLKQFPTDLTEKLLTTFGLLKHPVLYKHDNDITQGNVKMLKWVPQNDILGHPNTKLFISHCGKNGFWEGVYHGVPIICMAIHAETHTTKVKVKKYGIGSSINIFDDSVDELVEIINGVLINDSIYRNMKRISTLLRDRPETPRERAASAIEHVIKYGGEHMRPPSVDFGFLSYTNMDIWVILFLIDLVSLAFVTWLIRKCCCRKNAKKSKTE